MLQFQGIHELLPIGTIMSAWVRLGAERRCRSRPARAVRRGLLSLRADPDDLQAITKRLVRQRMVESTRRLRRSPEHLLPKRACRPEAQYLFPGFTSAPIAPIAASDRASTWSGHGAEAGARGRSIRVCPIFMPISALSMAAGHVAVALDDLDGAVHLGVFETCLRRRACSRGGRSRRA